MAMKYDDLLLEVLQLDPREQARLVEEVSQHLAEPTTEPRHHSILELRGLGKEIWHGIDAQEYVRRERASWEE